MIAVPLSACIAWFTHNPDRGSHKHPARDAGVGMAVFRCCYWRWKSRPLGRATRRSKRSARVIRRMSVEPNPLWGARASTANAQARVCTGSPQAKAWPSTWAIEGPPAGMEKEISMRRHTRGHAALDLFVVQLSVSTCSCLRHRPARRRRHV